MYEKIISKESFDEKFNFGTDFSDISIIPQIYEMQSKIINKENEYFIEKCMELHIDPNVLLNQTKEIHRLNAVIEQLEKALDMACQYLDDFSNTYECYHPNQQDPFWKEQWKEHILEEVQEDE